MNTADTFSRVVSAGDSWGDPEVGVGPWEATFGGAGLRLWSVANGVAKMQTTNQASTGQRIRGTRDVDLRVRFALTALARGGTVSTGLFARFRNFGGPSGDYVRMRVSHDGRHHLRLSLARVVSGDATRSKRADGGSVKARRWYWMRFRVDDATIRGKVWSVRETEPGWQMAMRHPSIARMSQTDVGIRTAYASSAVLPTILFDEFTGMPADGPGCR